MRRKILPYSPKAKDFAKQLRQKMTLPEVLLWKKLKGKQLGCDFDRQRPIDIYIVDFYCKELMLAIEIDGSDHDYHKDQFRQQRLENQGVRFLRFANHEVLHKMDMVIQTISICIEQYNLDTTADVPNPLLGGVPRQDADNG